MFLSKILFFLLKSSINRRDKLQFKKVQSLKKVRRTNCLIPKLLNCSNGKSVLKLFTVIVITSFFDFMTNKQNKKTIVMIRNDKVKSEEKKFSSLRIVRIDYIINFHSPLKMVG